MSMYDKEESIEANGFESESHHFETEDGYILKMYRIKPIKIMKSFSSFNPVLIMHGMTGQADNFITTKPDQSLGVFIEKHLNYLVR